MVRLILFLVMLLRQDVSYCFTFFFSVDGDNAWICWNDELLSCLPSHIESNPFLTALENAQVKIPSNLDSCIWSASIEKRIRYDRRFRHHLQSLGKYAELLDVSLDKNGFDHDLSIALGKAAYIQVRLPYSSLHFLLSCTYFHL